MSTHLGGTINMRGDRRLETSLGKPGGEKARDLVLSAKMRLVLLATGLAGRQVRQRGRGRLYPLGGFPGCAGNVRTLRQVKDPADLMWRGLLPDASAKAGGLVHDCVKRGERSK